MGKRKKKYRFKKLMIRGIKISSSLFLLGILSFVSVLIFGTITWTIGHNQPTQQQKQFINHVAPISQEMKERYGLLPSISIAQAILESNWGESGLAAQYYNLYGVKEFGQNPSVQLKTMEFQNGEWIQIEGTFRVYTSWRESIEDHARLMVEGVTWNPELYHPVLNANSYQEAAHALVQAGYATDPGYASKLIEIIELYQLYQYDQAKKTTQ